MCCSVQTEVKGLCGRQLTCPSAVSPILVFISCRGLLGKCSIDPASLCLKPAMAPHFFPQETTLSNLTVYISGFRRGLVYRLLRSGVMVYTCNSNTCEAGQENHYKFQANLVYIVISGPSGATGRPCLKKTNKNFIFMCMNVLPACV